MINFKLPVANDLNAITIVKPTGKSFTIKAGDIITAAITEVAPSGAVTLKVNGELINAKTAIELQKDYTGIFKALDTPAKGSELKLQFLGYTNVDTTKKETFHNILQSLNNLLNNKATLSEQNIQALLKILPDNPETLPKEIRLQLQDMLTTTLASSGKGLQAKLESLLDSNLTTLSPESKAVIAELKQRIFIDVENLTSNLLKASLKDTGVALEAKLKSIVMQQQGINPETISKTDLKAVLLALKEELAVNSKEIKDFFVDTGALKTIDTIVKDISTYQALSKLTNSFYTFAPLYWDGLKDADIAFKRSTIEDSPVPYSCRINLDLEEFGKVQIIVLTHKNEFFVCIKAEDEAFADILSKGLEELKQDFYRQGLHLKGAVVLPFDDPAFEDLQNLESVSQIVSMKI